MSCKDLRRLLAVAFLLVAPTLSGCDDGETGGLAPDVAPADSSPSDMALQPDAGPMADAAPADMAVPDAAPAPEVTPLDPARQADPQILIEAPVPMAVPLADGRIVAQGPEGIAVVSPEGTMALGAEPAGMTAAALVGRDLLVAGESGLYGMVDGALYLSPLDELVEGITAMDLTADGALWILDASGLHVYRDGRLNGVDPGPMAPDARTAVGTWDGTPALWVIGDEALYALGFGDDGLQAWQLEPEAPVSAVAVNSDGGLWMAAEGKLYHLAGDGTWTDWIVPFTVVDIAAHPQAPDLWIDVGGRLWQLRDGRVRPVENAPDYTRMRAEADGSVLLFGEGPLARVRPGKFLRLQGIDEGMIVDREITVVIEPTTPEQVSALTWSLDGGEAAELAGPPWELVLGPATVDEGDHVLRVEAAYESGEMIAVELPFRVQGPPTWDGDIEPMFLQHCDACHGVRGYAHRMETLEVWVDEIDDIIDAIVNDRMPLPPNPLVSDAELELIRAWADTGFLRSWP